MTWAETKQQLQKAIQRLRGNPIVDAGTKSLLRQIPLLGDFAVDLWSNLDAGDDEKSAQLVKLLEYAATSEEDFQRMTNLLAANGEALQAQKVTVDEILELADKTHGIAVEMNIKLDAIGGKLEGLFQIIEGPTAIEVIRNSAVIKEDRDEVKRLLEMADATSIRELPAENALRLGVLYAAESRYQEAELCFVAATERDPEMTQAYLGLAAIHQLEGNRHIAEDNFGLAAEELKKASAYADTAWRDHNVEPQAVIQMGYTEKELAQRYILAGRRPEGDPWLERADVHFKMALGVDPDNASAHNGLGDVALIRGDYDKAIEECSRATALQPNYLLAHYDLAEAYYARAGRSENASDKVGDAVRFVETFQTVLELDGTQEAGTLPSGARDYLVGHAEETRDWLMSVTGAESNSEGQ